MGRRRLRGGDGLGRQALGLPAAAHCPPTGEIHINGAEPSIATSNNNGGSTPVKIHQEVGSCMPEMIFGRQEIHAGEAERFTV